VSSRNRKLQRLWFLDPLRPAGSVTKASSRPTDQGRKPLAPADALASFRVPDDLKLDRIGALLRALGDPQDRFRIVHVAGSKGKGSTSALLAAILQRAGYRIVATRWRCVSGSVSR